VEEKAKKSRLYELAFGRRRKMDGEKKRSKKKTETSLMLLVAVNKFQPKKCFTVEDERRDGKQRGEVAGKKRNVCEEAVLFSYAF
jgi:hypothetical protein